MTQMKQMMTILGDDLRTWVRAEAPLLSFAAKATLAALLALLIAFRLDFAQPQWSLFTVLIVARKDSGLVLTKSFYRLTGTLVGCGVSIVLVSLFAQVPELFLLGLAIWIGICVCFSMRYRGFQSYAFMLSGYTAAIIGFGAAAAPEFAFDIAQARVSEVVLGILCAGFVAEAFLPSHAAKGLVTEAGRRFAAFTKILLPAVSQQNDESTLLQTHQQFIVDLVSADQLRSSLFFESAEARFQDAALRQMNAAFMEMSSTLHSYMQCVQRLHNTAPLRAAAFISAILPGLQHCLDVNDAVSDTATIAQRLQSYQVDLNASVAIKKSDVDNIAERATQYELNCAITLYQRLICEFAVYLESLIALQKGCALTTRDVPEFAVHSDIYTSVFAGLRAAAVLLGLSAFWLASAWSSGVGAVTIATVFCVLLSSHSFPVIAVKRFGVGFAAGTVVGFFYLFYILPYIDGFEMLALVLAPVLFISARLIEHPRYSGESTGFYMMLFSVMSMRNTMEYNFISFANDSISILAGLGIAGLALSVVSIAPERLYRRLMASLRNQIAKVCHTGEPIGRAKQRFESHTRDLIFQLATPPIKSADPEQQSLACGLSVLEIGHAVLAVREELGHAKSSDAIRDAAETVLEAVAEAASEGSKEARDAALNALAVFMEKIHFLNASATPATSTTSTTSAMQTPSRLELDCYRLHAALLENGWQPVKTNKSVVNVKPVGLEVSHAA